MFYGTINSDGSINNQYAFSNNFTISHEIDSGVYEITFNEYLSQSPTLTATSISNNTASGNAVNAEWIMLDKEAGAPFRASVTTSRASHKATDHAFSFHARTGQTLLFDAKKNPTLSLEPRITSFTYDDLEGNPVTSPVLTISVGIEGLDPTTAQPNGSGTYSVDLDKGSVLLGILQGGGTMTLEIPLTVEDSEHETWNLSGWTFGGGSGKTGTQWAASNKSSTYDLELSSEGEGPLPPMTALESFVIMATRNDGGRTLTLTTDPVVRLSSVPPGGISL